MIIVCFRLNLKMLCSILSFSYFILFLTLSESLYAQSDYEILRSEAIRAIETRDKQIFSIKIDSRASHKQNTEQLDQLLLKEGLKINTSSTKHWTSSSVESFYASKDEKGLIGYLQLDSPLPPPPANLNEILKRREVVLGQDMKLYDGKTNYFSSFTGKNKNIVVREGRKDSLFTGTTVGFRSNYDVSPIQDILKKYQIIGKETDKRFGMLLHLRNHSDTINQINIWIAIEKNNLIVRETCQTKFYQKFEIIDMIQVMPVGIYFPKSYTTRTFHSLNNEDSMINEYINFNDLISVNDASEDLFKMKIVKGDRFNDEANSLTWTIGENGERLYEVNNSKNRTQTMNLGWVYIASVSTLLLLTIGAYVKWKLKRWEKQA